VDYLFDLVSCNLLATIWRVCVYAIEMYIYYIRKMYKSFLRDLESYRTKQRLI
jgi:hypothetical protein